MSTQKTPVKNRNLSIKNRNVFSTSWALTGRSQGPHSWGLHVFSSSCVRIPHSKFSIWDVNCGQVAKKNLPSTGLPYDEWFFEPIDMFFWASFTTSLLHVPFQPFGSLTNQPWPSTMARSLPSRAWSGGSLDLGSRHLVTVKRELTNEREKAEQELEAGYQKGL